MIGNPGADIKVPDSLPSSVDLPTQTMVVFKLLVTEYTLLIHDLTLGDLHISVLGPLIDA
jgi:hypothetical protein